MLQRNDMTLNAVVNLTTAVNSKLIFKYKLKIQEIKGFVMELLNQAKTMNDFGLRKEFPWSGLACNSRPWTTDVKNKIEKNFIGNLLNNFGNLDSIKRIENPYLWARYVLSYEELKASNENYEVRERILIHATNSENAIKIADENFNWRLSKRFRYGRGVSFASESWYASKHSSQEEIFIIAGIIQSRSMIGTSDTKIPADCYDTTEDDRELVAVKYNDNDFYPYYIVENKKYDETKELLALLTQ